MSNTVHLIEFYTVLVQFPFLTSKTEIDIYYKKLYVRVVSLVVEQLKR